MGDARKYVLKVDFDRRLRLEFHGAKVTSNAGLLACRENILALMDLSGAWVDKVNESADLTDIILDLDSSESPTYGRQQGTAFNGYFGCTCYHPLFLFNQFGDLERAMLRRGNVHTSKYWRRVLLPVIERYRDHTQATARAVARPGRPGQTLRGQV